MAEINVSPQLQESMDVSLQLHFWDTNLKSIGRLTILVSLTGLPVAYKTEFITCSATDISDITVSSLRLIRPEGHSSVWFSGSCLMSFRHLSKPVFVAA